MSVQTFNVAIHTETIALGQFLKFVGLIEQGGEAKRFLNEHNVLINGAKRTERGAKLKPGDVVDVDQNAYVLQKE